MVMPAQPNISVGLNRKKKRRMKKACYFLKSNVLATTAVINTFSLMVEIC